MEEKKLTPEEIVEMEKALRTKVEKASKEIQDVLEREDLAMFVEHIIRIVPRQ